MGKKSTRKFKTEVREILELIIHSLYSHREIFLRELISNASDAIDKHKFRALTDPSIKGGEEGYKIKLVPDAEARTLEVTDNGIGMTKEEVVENIGTIAHSGTSEFLDALNKAQSGGADAPELIGQFGVGFYSAFMVADRITLTTRAPGEELGVRWESAGDGSYTIEEVEKPGHGTSILLHLREPDGEEEDYTDPHTLSRVVKQHSDFVAYPVTMDVVRKEPVLDDEGNPKEGEYKDVIVEDVLNSMKAIWARPKSEIEDEEYNQFYKHISHDWLDPLSRLHLKLEGATEFDTLLFIPSKRPMDLFWGERQHGVKLYSKRVFIMENCKELVPDYLRFLRGVVDSADLSLNVSREILQENRVVRAMRKTIVRKVLDHLASMEEEQYLKFYKEFGVVIKEGVHTDPENRDKIAKLLRYPTTASEGELKSLDDYVARMMDGQEDIYYITGDTLESLSDNPHLEKLKAEGYEVLLMAEPVDEFVAGSLGEYEGKKLKSAETGDIEVKDEGGEEEQKEFEGLIGKLKELLGEKVQDVKASKRLTDSASCLSSDNEQMSAMMIKMLKASGHKLNDERRILEVNLSHPLVAAVKAQYEEAPDSEELAGYAELLFDLALVSEGARLSKPADFSKRVAALAAKALGG